MASTSVANHGNDQKNVNSILNEFKKLQIDSEMVTDKPDEIKESIEISADSKRLAIEECSRVLEHVSQCKEDLCNYSCRRLKRVISHMKACKKRTNQIAKECKICNQFFSLCHYHAKNCEDLNCSVLNCVKIRKKLEHKKIALKSSD